MLIDGRTLPADNVLETDLCIIGAGAAGITLGLTFADHPDINVCLVESGGFEFDAAVQELYRGESTATAYEPYDTRMRMFGGSTNHWGGWCRPLEESDFEVRPWVPHSGWPIRLGDLAPYYDEAAGLCEVDRTGLTVATWSERLDLPALDLDGSRLRNMIFQVSPPTRFGEKYRARLLAAGNLTICLYASLLALRRPPGSRAVERVEAVGTLAGNRFAVRARCFVLACGGIENARLLLHSARAADGLPDPHQLVGRFFMEHAHFNLGQLALGHDWDPRLYLDGNRVPGASGLEVNAHLGLSAGVEAAERIATAAVQIRPRLPSHGERSLRRIIGALRQGRLPDDLGHHLQQVLADIGALGSLAGDKLVHALFHDEKPGTMLSLRSVGEQVPNPDSRVMLADDVDALGLPRVLIDWRLSELDRLTIKRVGEICAAEFGRLGLGRMQLAYEDAEAEPEFIEWGYHHIGTTRMADDPKQGVVDRHCRLHVAENCYVAGSSVFPTGGSGTPTITLIALALRLADHLQAKLFV